MGEKDELEMLLGEIPYATSLLNLHQNHPTKTSNGTMYGMYNDDPSSILKYKTCESPVSGFSLPSDGSSSSLLSNRHDPLSPPHHNSSFSSVLPHVFDVSDKSFGNIRHENLVGEGMLSDLISNFCISDERENFSTDSNRFQPFNRSTSEGTYDMFGYCGRGFPVNPSADPNKFPFVNGSTGGAKRYNVDKLGNFDYGGRVFSENPLPYLNGIQFGDHSVYGDGSINEGNYDFNRRCFSNYGVPESSVLGAPGGRKGDAGSAYLGRLSGMNCPSNPYTCFDYSTDNKYSALLGGQLNRMNMNQHWGGFNMYNIPHNAHWPHSRVQSVLNGRTRAASNSYTPVDSLIVGAEGLNFVKKKENERIGAFNHKGSSPLNDSGLENPRGRSSHLSSSLAPLLKYESLVEVQGYIHMIAKDQDGCRFLQRIFEEGTPQDMQIVFGEIIGHVVELMVDPFGNYLMQKLLEVCSEEKRMQILLMLTETPGQLIRISLNTHGTRVVQKLIETLKTKQHVSLVISALQPGFLALIKDLNGNHVIKQCLQSFSHEDNKFIFVGASKYCVEVATHQHGCCVLQCCISLLTGKHRDNLVKEVSANGILLAEDEYGNFVIQYILELEIPSAKTSLISQFEGNFVHLSTQKFSSHVVEKCLAVFDNDLRSKIIQELLLAPHFKQLLQDPYANYVIGKALKLTEGSRICNVLVEAIQCHESILRNCPYSKKLLSALKQYRGTTTSHTSPPPRSF